MKIKILFFFQFIFLISATLAQDFDLKLKKVKELKNSQYPDNKDLVNSLQKSAKSDFEKNLAQYYLSKYYTQISEYDSALNTLKTVRTKFKQTNKILENAKAYHQTGVIYFSFLNDFVKGKSYLDSAKALFEKAGNREGIADCMRDEATIYYYLGDIDRSNELLIKILPEFTPNTRKYLDIKDLIVNNYIAKNDYNAAYKNAKNIPEAYLKIKELRRYAYSIAILGQIQKKKGMLKEAEQSLLASIKISENNKYNENMVNNNRYMGLLYSEIGKNTEAEYYLNQALKYTLKVGDPYSVMHTYAALSRHYITRHDFKNGDLYANMATMVGDSLYKEENNEKLAAYEAKYESSKKEAEIATQNLQLVNQRQWIFGLIGLVLFTALGFGLFYTNRQAKQKAQFDAEKLKLQTEKTSAIVEAEERERIRLAKELHDGVGPMLSIAKFQLENAISQTKFNSIEQESLFQNTNTMIDDAAREIRTVSHDLMPNALLMQGLVSAVREFVGRLSLSGKVKVLLDVANLDERLPQLTETVLYRVLQKLVGNIIKHSEATQVQIQLIRNENELTMMIEDDGKGFDTTKMADFKGIGLKNIISRVDFLKGKVNFDSSPNSGTTVIIEIPLS
jgi:two-component system, NarL family, sensor kinase